MQAIPSILSLISRMEGNLMCSSCGQLPAALLCFCNFPLPHLCSSQCLTKHRSLPRFHFEVPISVAGFVTKDNFNEWQDWLFRLSRAQEALRENLTALEAFEGEMEGIFTALDRDIEAMKGEYRREIREIRGKVGEMVTNAIAETSQNALNPESDFTSPLSEWIWWRAHPAHALDLRLYSPRLRMMDREGITRLVEVEMNKLSPLLPELPAHLQPIHRPNPALSGPIGLLSILSQAQTPFPIEPVVPKPTNCRVCQAAFTLEDLAYHCVGACRCKACTAEALTEATSSICRYCYTDIPHSVVSLANRGMLRCHVCGIAVKEQEIEQSAKCLICCQCVTIETKDKYVFWKTKKGRCRQCKSDLFDLNEEQYREMRTKAWGCCEQAVEQGNRLACGHWVCRRHEEHLKSCRACQKMVLPRAAAEAGFQDLIGLE